MMNLINRVLVIVEPGAEQQPAIDRLRNIARYMDVDVRLIACDYSQYLIEGYYFSEAELPALRKEYLADRKELLENLAAPLREGGLTISTEAIWSHPRYKAIVAEVAAFKPDLVIHHVHRHAALSRMLMSSDDWQLVRHCQVPLLLVKDKPWKDEPVILCAVDPMHGRHKPSGLDHMILGTGGWLADQIGGLLYAVHAYGQFPLSGLYPADAEERHRAAFHALADEFDLPDTRRLLVDEATEFAVCHLEEELDVDLVIAGAISRSIISDILIGSTTEKLLDSLDCDVLLLRPDSKLTQE